jgi:hypothetical protein
MLNHAQPGGSLTCRAVLSSFGEQVRPAFVPDVFFMGLDGEGEAA